MVHDWLMRGISDDVFWFYNNTENIFIVMFG